MTKWTTALRILTQGKELKQEGKGHGITKVLKKMKKKKDFNIHSEQKKPLKTEKVNVQYSGNRSAMSNC